MIEPHFLTNHPIHKLIVLLYDILVLSCVLCQIKTSQMIRTINKFLENITTFGLLGLFFRICVSIAVIGIQVMNRNNKPKIIHIGIFCPNCYKHTSFCSSIHFVTWDSIFSPLTVRFRSLTSVNSEPSSPLIVRCHSAPCIWKMYSILFYVIRFISDMHQVSIWSGFLHK